MLGAIYIGLSGMDAYSKGLQIISNNIANLNTPGFKAASVQFNDLFDAGGGGGLTYLGSSFAPQGGQGVRVGTSLTDFKQGDLRQTGNDLDLGIKGSGFLMLLHGDQVFYARTGSFAVDKEGYISQQGTGYHLAVLDANGKPVAVNVDTKRINAGVATTKISFAGNISTSDTNDPKVSDIVVYDSNGVAHKWTATFTKTTNPGEWSVKITDLLGMTVETGTTTLRFNGSDVDTTAGQIVATATPDNASPMSVTLDFPSGAVTSTSSGTVESISAPTVNGNPPGSLTTVSIDDTGQVLLTYSNQKTEQQGAVAIADFRDLQGLKQQSNGLFTDAGAGERRLLASGKDGIGTIASKQLEASNVDLSAEFGNLILVQRGFQACSQVVSVSNDMIQQLFGIRGQG